MNMENIKEKLKQVKHFTPHVVFEDSPLYYLTESIKGNKFNNLQGEKYNYDCQDPGTIYY